MRHSRGPRSSHPIFGRQLFQRKQWARLHRVAQSFISGIGAGRLKREKITQPSSNPLLVSSPCSRLLKIIGRSQGWKHDSLSLFHIHTLFACVYRFVSHADCQQPREPFAIYTRRRRSAFLGLRITGVVPTSQTLLGPLVSGCKLASTLHCLSK